MTVYKAGEENLGVIITSSSSTNGFLIAHIDPESVIFRDGRFRTGDKIVRINGHDLLELSISLGEGPLTSPLLLIMDWSIH